MKCPISADGIAALNVELFTFDMWEREVKAASRDPNNIQCETCEETVASLYCTQCTQPLCEACGRIHKRSKVSASHVVVELAQGLVQEQTCRPSFCPDHPSLELKGYCKTCQVSTCSECSLLKHSLHATRPIGEVAHETRARLQPLSAKVSEKSNLVSEAVEGMAASLTELRSNTDEAEACITAQFDTLTRLLSRRQAELLQISDTHDIREKALRLQKEFLEDALLAMVHTCQFTTTLLGEATDAEVATSLAGILARLETLHDQEMLLVPEVSPVIRITELDDSQISKALNSFGKVATE